MSKDNSLSYNKNVVYRKNKSICHGSVSFWDPKFVGGSTNPYRILDEPLYSTHII